MMITLSDLPGLGPKRLQTLREAGITTVEDLLFTLPAAYLDMTKDTPIKDIEPGQSVCVTGFLCRKPTLSRYNGLSCVSSAIRDNTGTLPLQWYNQPWMQQTLQKMEAEADSRKQEEAADAEYDALDTAYPGPPAASAAPRTPQAAESASGQLTFYGRTYRTKQGRLVMNSPTPVYERMLLPVYSTLKGIPGKTLRDIMHTALSHIDECLPETLPETIRRQYSLCERNFALRQAHFPSDSDMLALALRRLSFESVLYYQIAMAHLKQEKSPAESLSCPGAIQQFLSSLPFPPTNAQRRVLDEIEKDLLAPQAMNRMVQGDVGCGKTAVAFACLYLCARAGKQAVLLAPTEILARQHMLSAEQLLSPLGIRCGLLLGGMKAKDRKAALSSIESGEWQCVIGTHALLSKDVRYHELALVITDEQHRFGVRQRASLLSENTEKTPHALVMSATPIPRSLQLVMLGDLDLSVIDELPAGRKPVLTRLVPEGKREDLYRFIVQSVREGHQAYIVCPLVEESETLDISSAKDVYASLSMGALKELRLGLTWGNQKTDEKEKTLHDFAAGLIDVLIATTVVEVGVNVPNATIMVIENADRFGLSQLHQLRGRVGRGSDKSWCFLMAEKNERLQALCETNDGFRIAEKDLELRGPGDYLGTRQHGEVLPGMQFTRDITLFRETAECLKELMRTGSKDELAQITKNALRQFAHLTEGIAFN